MTTQATVQITRIALVSPFNLHTHQVAVISARTELNTQVTMVHYDQEFMLRSGESVRQEYILQT